jgi:ribonuclease HI
VTTVQEAGEYLASRPSSWEDRLLDAEEDLEHTPTAVIYTDGSCALEPRAAGWGFVVLNYSTRKSPLKFAASLVERSGPVCLDPAHPDYLGALVLSNNTGELSAIGQALRWALTSPLMHGVTSIQLRSDSQTSIQVLEGSRSKANRLLVRTLRALLADARSKSLQVSLLWVKGHQTDLTSPDAY